MVPVKKFKRDKMVNLEGAWEVTRVEKEIRKEKKNQLYLLYEPCL